MKNRWFIEAAAATDHSLLIPDIDNIITSVAHHLDEYDGDDDDESFQSWVSGVVGPAVRRLGSFYTLRAQYTNSVRKGIWSLLEGCADLGIDDMTVASLESITWMKVFQNLDGWLTPGTAKLNTRFFAAGRMQALGWRQDRLRNRAKFITLDDAIKAEETGAGLSQSGDVNGCTADPDADPDADHAGDEEMGSELEDHPFGIAA